MRPFIPICALPGKLWAAGHHLSDRIPGSTVRASHQGDFFHMYCWSCGHKNSDANKFCGECGKVQVRPPVFVDAEALEDNVKTMNPPPREHKRISDAPPRLASDPPPTKAPVVPPPGTGLTPTPPPARYVSTNPLIGESRVVREKPLAPAVEPVKPVPPPVTAMSASPSTVRRDPAAEELRGSTRISGPSFLGLSDAPDSSGSSEYLLEDDSESSSTARSYIALGLVLLLGVLIYKQWDAVSSVGRDLIARATAAEPAPTTQSSPEDQTVSTASNANQPAYHPLDEAKPESDSAATPAEATAAEKKPAETAAAEKSATELAADKAAAEPPPAEAKDAGAAPIPSKKVEVAPSKPATARAEADAAPAAPAAPVYDDSQLEIAQKYLQGRGVAQDCNRGVSLLRSAAMQPNPKAQIKLGALYATGHCVSQDRAEAYRWFAEAHQLQPGNQWIDKNLNSLWAAMTAEERGRAQR